MKKHILTAILTLLTFTFLHAQILVVEKNEHQFTLSGSVDVFFRTNINGNNVAKSNSNDYLIAQPTSFANTPGFSLGMINAVGEYKFKKVGAVVDIVVGPRGEAAVFNSTTTSN